MEIFNVNLCFGVFRAIIDIDEKQFINIRIVLMETRNHLATLYDVITKNIEKIKKPRNSHNEHMYWFHVPVICLISIGKFIVVERFVVVIMFNRIKLRTRFLYFFIISLNV
jgi:hypothetical protein